MALSSKHPFVLESQAVLYLRLSKLFYKQDDMDDGDAAEELEASAGIAVSKNKDAALNYARHALKAVKGLEKAEELQKQIYTDLLRQLVRRGAENAETVKLIDEIQMKFYYQSMKTVYDMDLMEVMGEHEMMKGNVQQALNEYFRKVLGKGSKEVYGLTSVKILNLQWKLGEINLHLGNTDKA